jgi:hypothetical protein
VTRNLHLRRRAISTEDHRRPMSSPVTQLFATPIADPRNTFPGRERRFRATQNQTRATHLGSPALPSTNFLTQDP